MHTKLSFLPGPAVKLAQLEEDLAQRVLDTLAGGIARFDRHERYRSIAGAVVEVGFTRLHDPGIDIGVCRAGADLAVVCLDDRLAWDSLMQYADLASVQSVLIGPIALEHGSVRQLLNMLRAYVEQANVVVHPALIPHRHDVPSTPEATAWLARRLLGERHIRRWKSSQARQEFRDLLDSAITEPQIVDRDGDEVVVIGRELLDAYEQPKSAAELAAYFEARAKEHPIQALPIKRPEHLPRARFTLPDVP